MKTMTSLREVFSPKDMSDGIPWKRIAAFAFPMLLGNIAQQLYNTVDTIVVGNSHWGYTALSAVGSAGPILNLLLALFVGISTGAGIMVAQYFGAHNYRGLSKTIANCIILTGAASVFIMVFGPIITGPLLRLVGTLPELFDQCKQYLVIFFVGIAGFFFYNIFSGILRGMGDSFSALLYLLVAAALNIVLDLAFVEKMGVAGVALATVIAQFISAILCLRKMLSLKQYFTIRKEDLKPEKRYISRIISLGIPSGLSSAIMSLGMMVVQRLINSFGDDMFVAANVLTMRVDGYAMMPTFSFGMAMSTFAGQNIGAGRMDRLKTGLKQCMIMAVCTSAALTPVVLFGGPYLLRLFTPEQRLIELTMGLIYTIAAGYIFNAATQVWQGVVRGAGDTVSPMLIGFFTNIVLRIPLAYSMVYFAKRAGAAVFTQQKMVFLSMFIAWTVSMVISFAVYKRGKWKNKQVMHAERPSGGPAVEE